MSQVETQPSPGDKQHANFVQVSISTTAGFFPEEGFDRVPSHQKVGVQFEKAADKLGIKDTQGWIATVNEGAGRRPIDPDKNYIENRLSGQVEIDWGPSEGGGG